MMLNIYLDKSINKLVVETDDPTLHYFLEKKIQAWEYIPWKKQFGWNERTERIYDNKPKKTQRPDGTFFYILGRGWIGFLLTIFKDKISTDQFNQLYQEVLMCPSYRTTPFPGLRDQQNEDVLYMLKYKQALIQLNTGAGKTQIIATLANYFHDTLGKKVCLLAPSAKARDEIIKRCRNLFGMEVSDKDKKINGHLDAIITYGCMNSSKIKDPDARDAFVKVLEGYDVVLCDECEYLMNDAGFFMLDHMTNAEMIYAFSGTADKAGGEVLSFANGLSETVIRNKDVIKYFGPSLVFRLPFNRDIDNISVKTESLDTLLLPNLDTSNNLYVDIMTAIWTDPEVCRVITKIATRYPMLFIPINNLTNIISFWIENWFKGKFRVLLICHKGYVYYDIFGNETLLTLDEVCEYAKKGMIDIMPSTSSGYRALDIPGLENILLIQGKVAGVVLQSIGRVARSTHMNIISLKPKTGRKIPVYTKGAKERDEQMKTYYKYCDVQDVEIDEDDL